MRRHRVTRELACNNRRAKYHTHRAYAIIHMPTFFNKDNDTKTNSGIPEQQTRKE